MNHDSALRLVLSRPVSRRRSRCETFGDGRRHFAPRSRRSTRQQHSRENVRRRCHKALELIDVDVLLGLRTLGAVASVGPRELESQLGRDGRHAVLLARGLEPDQLDAWRPPLFTSAHRQFGEPVEDREALLFVARALCGDLADELGLRGAGAKHVRVRLIFDSTESEKRESIVRHPLSSATELFGLIGSWIKEWQPRAPIAELWIDLPVLEAAGRRQLRLWAGGDGSSEEVTAALERLQERFGDVIWQPLPA